MKKILIVSVFAISTFTTLNSLAWHGVATETTQWLNNIQLVEQVNEQINTIKRISDSIDKQIQDMASMPAHLINSG
ncbi:TPA: hypothetical protein MCU88_005399, partial [Klebsiella pneumoniae]|nr:hypothetical protein [Klebsiella pneumoniae]